MSRWRHSICDRCWAKREPGRTPVRIPASEQECCFCAERTSAGIFLRAHPDEVPCRGEHSES